MEDKILNEIREYYDFLLKVYQRQMDRYEKIVQFSRFRLKRNSAKKRTPSFTVKKPGDTKHRYLGGKKNKEVQAICEARYFSKSLEVMERDIALLKEFLDNYESISFNNILKKIPKVYRNIIVKPALKPHEKAEKWKAEKEDFKAGFPPYKPEELIHTTVDGTLVRSKSEMAIYNYLYNAGYTFVYELPTYGQERGVLFVPDFTVLSEIDYKTEVKIEHQGKYGDEEYRAASNSRQYKYWKNGFLPGRDVYFTFDDNRGGFDIGPIIEILKNRIRPNSETTDESTDLPK